MFPTNNTFNCYVEANLEAIGFCWIWLYIKIDHKFSMTTTLYPLKICNVSMNAHKPYYL